MDECLRVVFGFKGIEDLFGDKLLEIFFVLECVRDKKIFFVLFYGLEVFMVFEDNLIGSIYWCEVIDKYLVLFICYLSGMVCFCIFKIYELMCFVFCTYKF